MNKELKAKALYFLARREYAYKELFAKLKNYTDNESEIKELLQNLIDANYLSEERYIKGYLANKIQRYGMLKIKYLLSQKAADPELVSQILSTTEVDEYNLALRLWQKKFAKIAGDKKELAKQIRFLQNKGFSFTIIKRVLQHIDKGD